MIRARVLSAAGLREIVAAIPWAGDDASRVARGYPSRALVVQGLDPGEARALEGILDHAGAAAVAGGDSVAFGADPVRLAAALARLKDDHMLQEVFRAVSHALARWGEPSCDVPLPAGGILRLSQRVHVMGIVNVTPDSFSDGGRYLDAEAAIDHGLALAEEGADLLDIGAESTRPGAAPVDDEEERRRLLPVVEALSAKAGVPVGVDTMKASVARRALEAGAQILNDVSAGTHDPAMLPLAAELGAPIVLMHMRGKPRTMQADVRYADVVGEIAAFLQGRADAALASGVPRDRILVDPGFGFGKLAEHNLVLLRRLRELRCLGFPVLAGTSRKSFIGRVLGDAPPEDRLEGTAATVALAVMNGAAVVRVHDVRAMNRVVRLVEATMTATEPGDA